MPSQAAPRRAVESLDPATGEVWRTWTPPDRAAVDAAVSRARAEQPAWAARPLGERRRILGKFRLALSDGRREVAALIERETGKPAAEAMAADILTTLDVARFCQRAASRVLRPTSFTPANIAMWRKRVTIVREPHGVIGIISPWNYPLLLPASGSLAALVSGNAVILKPSELTPSTAIRLGELLHAAGVPDAIFQVLPGDGATGAALAAAHVDKIMFTGSAATGRKVAAACAERLIPCCLELGGSDPAIVLDDADLATAASGVLWGRFTNAGQTCVAPKRAIVIDAVYDKFVGHLQTAAQRLVVGAGSAGSDVGPLIRPWQADVLEAQLGDAVARGATAHGAARTSREFFAPTVVSEVTADMRIAREETFGPLLAVIRARDDDDAVAIANATPFGLSASVWGRDLTRAQRVAERVAAGTVHVNDVVSVVGMADVPHGGIKESGFGRIHGDAGLRECVREKSLVVDLFARWRQPWWFGYGEDHARNIDAFARFWHGRTVAGRASGAWRSVKMLFSKARRI